MLDDLKRALRMESPTPRLNETNLKKLSRGLRSSKKSLHSVHSALETSSVPDGHLGGRSVSLSTLLPSGGSAGGMRPRVNKLQTLEAKMASIEVSLGWKRRREALLETLPRAARDLVRELDTLHQALRDKDTVIQTLKTQITNLGGTVGGGGSEGGGALTETERRSVQERLAKVQGELDSKRVAVKNLKLALEKIDITDNIDVRIRAAELEYELEREELNILNLKEESNVLTTRLQENTPSPACNGVSGSNSSLHALLTSAGGAAALGGASLLSLTIPHTPGNPPFHVTPRPPLGCVIDWATDDTRLKKGDRLVEVNGEGVVGCGLEQVTRVMGSTTHLNLVVARPVTGPSRKSEDRSKEVKELSAKLDKTQKEKESFKSDNTRLSHRISYLEEQVLELQNALTCTREVERVPAEGKAIVTTTHQPGTTVIQVFQKGEQRLAVASPQLRNGEVERAQQYPTLPRVRSPDSSLSSPTSCSSSTSSSASSDPHHNHQHSAQGQGSASRPPTADHRKRVISPRPESKNEDSRPPSRTKPVPPKKPERLSLQRTTSLQNVEEGPSNTSAPLPTPTTNSTTSTWQQQPLQTWSSLDTDIHCQEHTISTQPIYERGCERQDYCSHENIYEKQHEHYPPSHHNGTWNHNHHYSGGGNRSGNIMMVVSATPMVTDNHMTQRPPPQGPSASTVTTTTTISDKPHHHYHPNHQHHSSHRPLSPDASYHLDTYGSKSHDEARDTYSPSATTTHYTTSVSHSHNHRNSQQHDHNHTHQRLSTYTHHTHFTLQSPPTPVASRNSANLAMASSPRPHEQWC
ncbi:uncharacterized protein LOC126997519 isoform X2 [Eriocheir sinensis]|uniref:uncharacterized protein LOC126997519 isoform X2 n=1 Tax=Eriocheir sinensis TaxID=95602 RepID=UPI0021C93028|nr:uncharacterized protein LOC126997519 isoform X2 [Eriocheir sinensis]